MVLHALRFVGCTHAHETCRSSLRSGEVLGILEVLEARGADQLADQDLVVEVHEAGRFQRNCQQSTFICRIFSEMLQVDEVVIMYFGLIELFLM